MVFAVFCNFNFVVIYALFCQILILIQFTKKSLYSKSALGRPWSCYHPFGRLFTPYTQTRTNMSAMVCNFCGVGEWGIGGHFDETFWWFWFWFWWSSADFAIFGDLWQSSAIFGDLWQSSAIFGDLQRYLAIFTDLWQSLVIFDDLWQTLAIFGNLWWSLAVIEITGNVLKLMNLFALCRHS